MSLKDKGFSFAKYTILPLSILAIWELLSEKDPNLEIFHGGRQREKVKRSC